MKHLLVILIFATSQLNAQNFSSKLNLVDISAPAYDTIPTELFILYRGEGKSEYGFAVYKMTLITEGIKRIEKDGTVNYPLVSSLRKSGEVIRFLDKNKKPFAVDKKVYVLVNK
jgi:hypothetical protein